MAAAPFRFFDPPMAAAPFRFFDLPAEVRLRVYEELLVVAHVIDLDPRNHVRLAPRLALFRVSRRMHDEAYRVFYAANTFRLFPLHARFFHTKTPLLARLPPRYRAQLVSVELRLGPGWTGLPRCWHVDAPHLGLPDARNWRRLQLFVECDPAAHDLFDGFRRPDDFFTRVCAALLRALFPRVPSIRHVEFDGFPSVQKDGPLMTELLRQVRLAGKTVSFGPLRGWADANIVDANV